MPEHLKSTPDTKEFDHYLRSFVKTKERQYRRKVLREVAHSLSMIVTTT